jgi:hypothetical protein
MVFVPLFSLIQLSGNLAERSSTVNDDDYDFQQQCASEMTGYHTSFLGFQTTLAQLAGDKGLANYDSSNNLETLLKDAVNANKNALSATAALVYNIPTLGPILGPSMYSSTKIDHTKLTLKLNSCL